MPPKKSFEESMQRLEAIVKELDDGRTDLETALARYEEGIGLLKACHGILENARRKIEVLRGVAPDGTPTTDAVREDEFKTDVAV